MAWRRVFEVITGPVLGVGLKVPKGKPTAVVKSKFGHGPEVPNV